MPVPAIVRFLERKHQAFYVDVMISICGVDVTAWIVGTVTISIAGRDGINSISFQLQNANSNFIITPQNLGDPQRKKNGTWRISDAVAPLYSEAAKYEIFRYKNEHPWNRPDDSGVLRAESFDPDPNGMGTTVVTPTFVDTDDALAFYNSTQSVPGQEGNQQRSVDPKSLAKTVSSNSGAGVISSALQSNLMRVMGQRMWPLHAHRCVFHKNDPIRCFIHNPLTQEDSWLPGFTGYVDAYPWEESYENGDSTIQITGHDIRALAQRMRVAKNPLSSLSEQATYLEVPAVAEINKFNKDTLFADVLSPPSDFVSFLMEGNRKFPDIIYLLTTGGAVDTAQGSSKFQGIGRMRRGQYLKFNPDKDQPIKGKTVTPLSKEARGALEDWHLMGLLGLDTSSGTSKSAKAKGGDTEKAALDAIDKFISVAEPYYSRSFTDFGELARLPLNEPKDLTDAAHALPNEASAEYDAYKGMFGNLVSQVNAEIDQVEKTEAQKKRNAEAAALSGAAASAAMDMDGPGVMTRRPSKESWQVLQDQVRHQQAQGMADAYANGKAGVGLPNVPVDLSGYQPAGSEEVEKAKKAIGEEATNNINELTSRFFVKLRNLRRTFDVAYSKAVTFSVRRSTYTYAEARAICKETTWDGKWAPDVGYVHFLSPSTDKPKPSSPPAKPETSQEAKTAQAAQNKRAWVEDAQHILNLVDAIQAAYDSYKNARDATQAAKDAAAKAKAAGGNVSSKALDVSEQAMAAAQEQNPDEQKNVKLMLAAFRYNSSYHLIELGKSGNIPESSGTYTIRDDTKQQVQQTLAKYAQSNFSDPAKVYNHDPKLQEPANFDGALADLRAFAKSMDDGSLKERLLSQQDIEANAGKLIQGGVVTSRPGTRPNPTDRSKQQSHWGYDIAQAADTPITSPDGYGTGKVEISKAPSSGFGCYVQVVYDNVKGKKIKVRYGHLDPDTCIAEGEAVRPGTVIGHIGSTTKTFSKGAAQGKTLGELGSHHTGPHLHLEAYTDAVTENNLIDPLALASQVIRPMDPKADPATLRSSSVRMDGAGQVMGNNDDGDFDAFDFAGIIETDMLDQLNNTDIEWQNRYELINEFCAKLDYQWWVSPIGDIFFEFPMADFHPDDFGAWKSVLTADAHIKSGSYNDEAADIPTVMKVTGNYSNYGIVNQETKENTKELPVTAYLIAPALLRRLGVNLIQETYPTMVQMGSIVKWGLLDFQKRLSAVSTFESGLEYRPFLLPNRPYHAVPRSRLGQTETVTHTMELNGVCSTSVSTIYTRLRNEMNSSFTTIFGTPSHPINYRDLLVNNPDTESKSQVKDSLSGKVYQGIVVTTGKIV